MCVRVCLRPEGRTSRITCGALQNSAGPSHLAYSDIFFLWTGGLEFAAGAAEFRKALQVTLGAAPTPRHHCSGKPAKGRGGVSRCERSSCRAERRARLPLPAAEGLRQRAVICGCAAVARGRAENPPTRRARGQARPAPLASLTYDDLAVPRALLVIRSFRGLGATHLWSGDVDRG